jgi:hypothetical protein
MVSPSPNGFVRKSQTIANPPRIPPSNQSWMDVEHIASVDVSSEDSNHPIESALLLHERGGWRATTAGTQTIRLIFDERQKLSRIMLVFEDRDKPRTQEFLLRWSPNIENSYRDIVHQQWNFSSPDSVRETEDYAVQLSNVKVLELVIVPDKNGGEVRASLVSLRLA